MPHCGHCKGLAAPCGCSAGCPKPDGAQCTAPLNANDVATASTLLQELIKFRDQLVAQRDSVAGMPNKNAQEDDERPQTCTSCGLVCTTEAQALAHATDTGHVKFRVTAPASARDRLPMMCTHCNLRCANRAEADVHTADTGHHRFQCTPEFSLHCMHCKGFAAPCGCRMDCPRLPGSTCYQLGGDVPRGVDDEDEQLRLAIQLSLLEAEAKPVVLEETPVPAVQDPRPAEPQPPEQAPPVVPAAEPLPPPAVDAPGPAAQPTPADAPPAAQCDGPEAARVDRLTDIEVGPSSDSTPMVGVMTAARCPVTDAAIATSVPDMDFFGYMASDAGFRLAQGDPNRLDKDEAGALYLYTMESALYKSLNAKLRLREPAALQPFLPLLRLLLGAAAKLPLCPPGTEVWRGVRANMKGQFPKGLRFYWWGFTSTTRSIGVLNGPTFLGKQGPRTLFAIKTTSGRDITRYSFHQGAEDEVLLLPGTRFEVVDAADLGEVQMVYLSEVAPPELAL